MALHVVHVTVTTTWSYEIELPDVKGAAEARDEALARWQAGQQPQPSVSSPQARWICASHPRKDPT